MTLEKCEGRTYLMTLVRGVLILLLFIKSDAGTIKGCWAILPHFK